MRRGSVNERWNQHYRHLTSPRDSLDEGDAYCDVGRPLILSRWRFQVGVRDGSSSSIAVN